MKNSLNFWNFPFVIAFARQEQAQYRYVQLWKRAKLLEIEIKLHERVRDKSFKFSVE